LWAASQTSKKKHFFVGAPAVSIQFIDLQAQRKRMGEALDQAVLNAVHAGQWIMGPQVKELEAKLAEFAEVKHAIACANGTDALMIVLRAWNIGPGDAVFVPAFTFAASAEVVALVGASPIFVDVLEDTFNMDSASLEAAIAMVKKDGKLKPRIVMSVDLFGQPADYTKIEAIVSREGLKLLCDSAQGFGGRLDDRVAGGIGDAASTSFFPAKPLGCYGDGGAAFTNDDELAALLRSIRMHGQGGDKYENVRVGMNSRLDTIQAAILLEKIKLFPEEIELREKVAQRYNEALGASNNIRVPHVLAGAQSTWAQYTIQVTDRNVLAAALKVKGVPTAIYYPIPLSAQKGYSHFPSAPIPVSEKLSKSVISLPMHPYLDEAMQDAIIQAVLESI
jgi:dTDP-4-amino-4,6-dideoxygalactose transaminase